MLFVVVPVALILDGEQTGLILFFHFFRNDLEVVLQKVDLFITLDQSGKKWTFLDIGCCHFVYDLYSKEMVTFCFDHPFLFFDHINIIIKRLDGCWLLVIHAAQSQLSRHCEMRQREQDSQLMQIFQTYVFLFSLDTVELLQHDGRNLHD